MNKFGRTRRKMLVAALAAATLAGLSAGAQAEADKVKVGVFPISSSLPYYVAIDRGYFKDLNIEPETIKLMGGPPNVAALMTNQIEVSAVLVTLEGLNADVKKPCRSSSICLSTKVSASAAPPASTWRAPFGWRKISAPATPS